MHRIYLDYNASTPLSDFCYQELISALNYFANPSSVYLEGRIAKSMIQNARDKVADLFNANSKNVVFTSGATESATTLLTQEYFYHHKKIFMSHLYFSKTEHSSISQMGRFPRKSSTSIPVNKDGIIKLNYLYEKLMLHDQKQGLPLVAIQYANHETGVIQPINKIFSIVKKAKGILIVDAVQMKKKLDIKYGDFFIVSAHKIGGPKGIGAFIGSQENIQPKPLVLGGGQEKGLRSGTEPLPLIVAFGAAANSLCKGLYDEKFLKDIQNYLEIGLKNICNNVIIYGDQVKRLPNTTYFSVPNIQSETMQIIFDLEGISISSGAACFSGKTNISPVLNAMDQENINGGIRVSTGWNTKFQDIEIFLKIFKKIIFNTL